MKVYEMLYYKTQQMTLNRQHSNPSLPPLSFHMMALVALFHLSDSQIWMQPMNFFRLQMLQQEAIASCVFNIWPQSTADQNRTNDGLKETEKYNFLSRIFNPPCKIFKLINNIYSSSGTK